MGALTISFLICLNVVWCSGPQLKDTFSLHNSLMGSVSSDILPRILKGN